MGADVGAAPGRRGDREVTPAPAPSPGAADPAQLLRSRAYVALLLVGAAIGVPVALVAYGFLKLVDVAQRWVYTDLPTSLGFAAPPQWWPVPLLALAGLAVAAAIRYLPGTGGHSPAAGFVASGAPAAAELPGIVLAAFASLALGAVVGPEAPLIALGGGLAALALGLSRRDLPAQATAVVGAAGSFAAVSTLLGSPLTGAFLLMEVAGVAGPTMGVLLVPGLLAAGIGALVFVGLDNLTGFGTFSLAVPDIPPFTSLAGTEFLWAVPIGLGAAVLGSVIRRAAQRLEPVVAERRLALTPVVGVGVALCAIAFARATDRGAQEVLFSGETALPTLIQEAGSWTVGALVLLVLAKSVAYALSLSCFRGGPTFPAMFVGAAAGAALSHLPGLPMIAGVAMGIGAMAVSILRLPLTSVLLTALFLQADALTLVPLVIVAVVVAFVATARLDPAPATGPEAAPPRPDTATFA